MSLLTCRIYSKTPKLPHVLLGLVHAPNTEIALEKAKRGEWHTVIGDIERNHNQENWLAMV